MRAFLTEYASKTRKLTLGALHLRDFDVVIVGAGAAGMMAAIEEGKRGRRVLVFDHARSPGEKIRISGGGRCNFTNLQSRPDRFISGNPRYAVSALARYKPADFVALVERYGIAYHEKTLGQLFCDGSSQQIIDMLLKERLHEAAGFRHTAPGQPSAAHAPARGETPPGPAPSPCTAQDQAAPRVG